MQQTPKDWSSTWHVVHNMANGIESAEVRQERLRKRGNTI